MRIKDLPKEKFKKVELHWGNFHDVIDTRTRECVATLWTLNEAKKDREYFREFVGLNLDKLNFNAQKFYAKKAKDGIWDVVVDVKKLNKRIFEEVLKTIKF